MYNAGERYRNGTCSPAFFVVHLLVHLDSSSRSHLTVRPAHIPRATGLSPEDSILILRRARAQVLTAPLPPSDGPRSSSHGSMPILGRVTLEFPRLHAHSPAGHAHAATAHALTGVL